MMPLSLVLVAQAYALLLDLPKPDSTPPVYPSFFLPEVIPWLPRVALMLLSESEYSGRHGVKKSANQDTVCTRMIGDGTCTIR